MFLVLFATFVTMRFYAMKAFCFVLLFSTLSYQANISKQVNEKSNLQDEKVDANSIVSDLKSGKRGVFAIGNVGSQLTLFVSGSGSTNSPSGGYQVAVSESKGAFKITGTPVPVPSGIPSDAAVIFYCKDSGDNLVAMNSKSVGVLSLPSGSYEPTKIDSGNVHYCYPNGNRFLSTTESLKFLVIDSNGAALKYSFKSDSDIKSSSMCFNEIFFGHLCINGDSISIKDKCDGSPLSGIISGFVGTTAYLVDGSGTVYSFPGSAFKEGGSAKLTKISSKDAWKGPSDDHQPTGKPEPADKTTSSNSFPIIPIIIVALILVLFSLGIVVYCCFFSDGKKKKKETGVNGKKVTQKTNIKKKKSSASAAGSPSSKKKKKANSSSKKSASPRGSRRSSSKLPKNSAASRKSTAVSGRR